MLDNSALSAIGIHQWHEGFGEFFVGSDIFIVNGFSVNICERLNYKQILDVFSKRASLTIMKLFRALDTSNFEYAIDSLRITRTVTNLLGTEVRSDTFILDRL
jgi:hypothetical protein